MSEIMLYEAAINHSRVDVAYTIVDGLSNTDVSKQQISKSELITYIIDNDLNESGRANDTYLTENLNEVVTAYLIENLSLRKLKIGQRFNVVECVDNKNLNGYVDKGFQSIGTRHHEMPNVDHVVVFSTIGLGSFTLFTNEFKKIGSLIITKLK